MTRIIFLCAICASSLIQNVASYHHERRYRVAFVSDVMTNLINGAPPIPTRQSRTSPPKIIPKTTWLGADNTSGSRNTPKLFEPGVLAVKAILGQETLNKIRGKTIQAHSSVIIEFVKTYDTSFGREAMMNIFRLTDADGNGQLDKAELKRLLKTRLGFVWLDDAKIDDLVGRMDADANDLISYEEFVDSFPRILKTNLIKLAKKNGDDLGFLS